MDWDYTFVAIDGGRYASCQFRDRGEREEANRQIRFLVELSPSSSLSA